MAKTEAAPVPRLQERYEREIVPELTQQLGRTNRFSLPRLEKIVVSMGVSSSVTDKKFMEEAISALTEITGQKPVRCKAKKSVAAFRVRQGMDLGAKVTLRKTRMYEFMDRLVTVALPRVRDFRGLNPRSFDGRGNYALGIKEHLVFPEINYDKVEQVWGMDVIITTTAKTDDEARALLRHFNFPFRQ